MIKKRRNALLTALLMSAMVFGATSASAGPKAEKFNETSEFTAMEDNPCTEGDDQITLHVTEHIQGKTWTENGTTFMEVHISGIGQGAAANGTNYTGKLNVNASGTFIQDEPEEVEFHDIFRLISQGPAPNFLVHARGHFMPPDEVTLEFERVECRG